jgi:FkbM family methyltransferase
MTVYSDSPIAEDLYCNGFERAERTILVPLFQPDARFLDIGANIGFYSLLAGLLMNRSGAVMAFEPFPATYRLLVHNVQRNSLADVIECRQVAVSNEISHAGFHVFHSSGGVFNSLGIVKDPKGRPYAEKVLVDTTTLDDILVDEADDKPMVIKIDVEGFEEFLIRGGLESLNRLNHVALLIELNQRASVQCGGNILATVNLLHDSGYQVFQLFTGNRIAHLFPETFQRIEEANIGSDNVLFLKGRDLDRLLAGDLPIHL